MATETAGDDRAWLDMLCLTGEVGWARVSSGPTQMVAATPIGLYLRIHSDVWVNLREQDGGSKQHDPPYTDTAGKVLEHLRARGASFRGERIGIVDPSVAARTETRIEQAREAMHRIDSALAGDPRDHDDGLGDRVRHAVEEPELERWV